jgi:hypothetical protein
MQWQELWVTNANASLHIRDLFVSSVKAHIKMSWIPVSTQCAQLTRVNAHRKFVITTANAFKIHPVTSNANAQTSTQANSATNARTRLMRTLTVIQNRSPVTSTPLLICQDESITPQVIRLYLKLLIPISNACIETTHPTLIEWNSWDFCLKQVISTLLISTLSIMIRKISYSSHQSKKGPLKSLFKSLKQKICR